jgi:hypothetical protein
MQNCRTEPVQLKVLDYPFFVLPVVLSCNKCWVVSTSILALPAFVCFDDIPRTVIVNIITLYFKNSLLVSYTICYQQPPIVNRQLIVVQNQLCCRHLELS